VRPLPWPVIAAPADLQRILWSVKDELVSVNAAAKAIGMTGQGLSRWVDQGRIRVRGRGPRRAVLVSLSEVQEAVAWSRSSVGQTQAARMLRVEPRRVVELCRSGALAYRQPGGRGGDYEIDCAAVEKLAAERARDREAFVSLASACARTGWPRWVFLRFIEDERLSVTPGARGAKWLKVAELDALVGELSAKPALCSMCGLPLPPGRKAHKGQCAMTEAIEARRSPAVQARLATQRRDELEGIKATRGLREVDDVATELDRSPRSVWGHIANHSLGTMVTVRGLRRLLLSREDIEQIRHITTTSDVAALHGDPARRAAWYHHLHKSTKMYGRAAQAIAASRPNKRKAQRPRNQVGRPSDLLDDSVILDRLRDLARQPSMSQQRMAYRLSHEFGVAVSRDQVKRALKRLRTSSE